MKRQHAFIMNQMSLMFHVDGYPDNGSAILNLNEDELNFDREDETGEDFVWIPLEKSDLLALRGFLNERFDDDGNVMPYMQDFSREPKNFLWLLTSIGERPAFDYFDSLIVSAESEEAARAFRPENPISHDDDCWPTDQTDISAECIGVSWKTPGTVLIQGSFNQS